VALGFSVGKTREDLHSDKMLAFALVRTIEIIGGAASQIRSETKEIYTNIPWPEIVGMRNRVIHAYFDIDLDRVWDTIKDDIPPLVENPKSILKTFD
jgi:uncharacterized protein with HEPN domain